MSDVSYDSLLGAIRSLLVLIFLKVLFFSKFQVKGKILKGIIKLIHGYYFFFFAFCSQIVTWQNSSFFATKLPN